MPLASSVREYIVLLWQVCHLKQRNNITFNSSSSKNKNVCDSKTILNWNTNTWEVLLLWPEEHLKLRNKPWLNVVARACFLSQSNQHHVRHRYHGIQINLLINHQCWGTRKANWSNWRQCWIKYTEWKSTRNHNGCMVGRVRHKQQRLFIMNHQRKHKNTHFIHGTIMLRQVKRCILKHRWNGQKEIQILFNPLLCYILMIIVFNHWIQYNTTLIMIEIQISNATQIRAD